MFSATPSCSLSQVEQSDASELSQGRSCHHSHTHTGRDTGGRWHSELCKQGKRQRPWWVRERERERDGPRKKSRGACFSFLPGSVAAKVFASGGVYKLGPKGNSIQSAFFFLSTTALLRCNAQTIQFTHLKEKIQWFLVYLQSCATITIINFKETLTHQHSLPISPQDPSLRQPLTYFCLVSTDLLNLDIPLQWTAIIYWEFLLSQSGWC